MTSGSDSVPERLTMLADLVEACSGLRFADGRRAELASKAAAAFANSGCSTWDVYLVRLMSSEGTPLLESLLESLTVGETYFFRHRRYFEALESLVVPALIAQRQATRQLRLWSAGCATGEEAYSLAILVRQLLRGPDAWHVSVLATDLNRSFLARAREGIYSAWSFRESDERFKASYFTRVGAQFRIRPDLRGLVRFAHLNLAQDGYPSLANGTAGLDLILCRNVLIYFSPELSRRVVAGLRAALVPGGWLVLGPSDPVPGLLAGLERIPAPEAILYRRVESQHTAPLMRLAGDGFMPQNEHVVLAQQSTGVIQSLTSGNPSMATATTPMRAHAGPAKPRCEHGGAVLGGAEPPAKAAEDVANPRWQEVLHAARASADHGNRAEAEALCQQAIAQAKLQPEPYYLLGVLQQARGDDAAAQVAFRQALYTDRAFVPACLALAALYRRLGQVTRAVQALQRAQRLVENRPDDELVLADEGLTVRRLRDAVAQALTANTGAAQ